jgi:VIT1/CCC1 family predicted Fe2+/Mn2+ transporter
MTLDDVKGAMACGWLVVACTIPASVPFVLLDDAHVALRVSNFLLVGMLFVAGFLWGHYANTSRWWSGLVFMVVGLVFVAVAIALGG